MNTEKLVKDLNKLTNNSGDTSSRPTDVNVGFNYFDTTLNKPVWYKGSNIWVDSTGTEV